MAKSIACNLWEKIVAHAFNKLIINLLRFNQAM